MTRTSLTNKNHFLFYGNSSEHIGAGHIMRLFALAQYAQEQGIKITFLYKECLPPHLKKLHQEGFSTVKLEGDLNTAILLKLMPTHLVIDDYYLNDIEWQSLNNVPIFKIIFDDALNTNALPADLIVNATPSASSSVYRKRAPYAKLCLGPAYAILRKEFRDAIFQLPNFRQREQILITMGGTDIKKLSLPLCENFLMNYPHLKLSVIMGFSTAKQNKALELLASNHSQLSVYININNIAEVMMQGGLALSAAGNTMYELGCMSIPTIALICADNQALSLNVNSKDNWYYPIDFRNYDINNNHSNNRSMINKACSLANELYLNYDKRFEMYKKIDQIIDTGGCLRILEHALL